MSIGHYSTQKGYIYYQRPSNKHQRTANFTSNEQESFFFNKNEEEPYFSNPNL